MVRTRGELVKKCSYLHKGSFWVKFGVTSFMNDPLRHFWTASYGDRYWFWGLFGSALPPYWIWVLRAKMLVYFDNLQIKNVWRRRITTLENKCLTLLSFLKKKLTWIWNQHPYNNEGKIHYLTEVHLALERAREGPKYDVIYECY